MTKKYLWDTSNTKYYRKQLRHVNWRGPEKKKTGAKIFRPQKKKVYAIHETKYPIHTCVRHRAFCVDENHDDDDVGTASTHADGGLAFPSTFSA